MLRLFSRCSLTRVSGRDGRVLWDVDVPAQQFGFGEWPHFFGDLDGDGATDALLVMPDNFEHSAVAISLRDGKQLWSVKLASGSSQLGRVRVGDLDGDGRHEVVVVGHTSDRPDAELGVRVLDGRDGKVRWTWALKERSFTAVQANEVALANFDGNATRSVCVSLGGLDDGREIIILDASGKQRARRSLGGGAIPRSGDARIDERLSKMLSRLRNLGPDVLSQKTATLTAADLDGDGRDELLLYQGEKIHGWDRDLKELWFWPARFRKLDQVIPPARGRPGMVILPPGIFLEAAKGQPRGWGKGLWMTLWRSSCPGCSTRVIRGELRCSLPAGQGRRYAAWRWRRLRMGRSFRRGAQKCCRGYTETTDAGPGPCRG